MYDDTQTDDTKTVDLASLDVISAAEKGAVMPLCHPVTGVELGMSIRLAGADSEIYRKAQRAAVNKRVNKRRNLQLSQEEMEEESLTLLVKITLGWDGVLFEGELLPYGQENARMLYRRFPWIREQVDRFVHDRGNYLQD